MCPFILKLRRGNPEKVDLWCHNCHNSVYSGITWYLNSIDGQIHLLLQVNEVWLRPRCSTGWGNDGCHCLAIGKMAGVQLMGRIKFYSKHFLQMSVNLSQFRTRTQQLDLSPSLTSDVFKSKALCSRILLIPNTTLARLASVSMCLAVKVVSRGAIKAVIWYNIA